MLVVTYQIGGAVYHRKRSFGKVLNTFGEVGGIFEVTMVVFGVIFLCLKCFAKSEKQIIKEGVIDDDEVVNMLKFYKRYETGFEGKNFKERVIDEVIDESQDGFRVFKDA